MFSKAERNVRYYSRLNLVKPFSDSLADWKSAKWGNEAIKRKRKTGSIGKSEPSDSEGNFCPSFLKKSVIFSVLGFFLGLKIYSSVPAEVEYWAECFWDVFRFSVLQIVDQSSESLNCWTQSHEASFELFSVKLKDADKPEEFLIIRCMDKGPRAGETV